MNIRFGSVLITGASGFLGSVLVEHFSRRGWNVVACSRNPTERTTEALWREHDLTWTALPHDFMEGVQTVIHAAFIKGRDASDAFALNLAGSRLLVDAARERGAHFIFVSSLACDSAAVSEYGKQKHAIEQLLPADAAAVRAGLILGRGGLFDELYSYLEHNRFVPLIGDGRQPLQTVYIEDIASAIYNVAQHRASGIFTVAERTPVLYREFLTLLSARTRTRVRFVPVPFGVIVSLIGLAKLLGLKLPIERDNVLGLVSMRQCKITEDPLILHTAPRTYAESLEAMFPSESRERD